MSARHFEARLIEALSALEAGDPVEAILARYPDDAEALRPHLQMALALSQMSLRPSAAARARSHIAFLAAAEEMRERRTRRWLPFPGLSQLPALEALALLLVVIGLGTVIGVVLASRTPVTPADQPTQAPTVTPEASPTETAPPEESSTPQTTQSRTGTPAATATITATTSTPTRTPNSPTQVIVPPPTQDDDNDNGDNDNDDGDDDDNEGGDDDDGDNSGPGGGDDD